jgi:[ribosomal protein S5]-alanine N-acetyltransferase
MSTASPRITLRPFRAADAEALFPIFADPLAMKYWSTPPHASIDVTVAFVRATMEATASGLGDDQAVIFEGRVIGKAGLWDNKEIGLILTPDLWGRGLAREALEAVIARARSGGLKRIAADVDPRNAASIGLLARLGFVQTGEAKATAKVGDEWVDSLYFELALDQEAG